MPLLHGFLHKAALHSLFSHKQCTMAFKLSACSNLRTVSPHNCPFRTVSPHNCFSTQNLHCFSTQLRCTHRLPHNQFPVTKAPSCGSGSSPGNCHNLQQAQMLLLLPLLLLLLPKKVLQRMLLLLLPLLLLLLKKLLRRMLLLSLLISAARFRLSVTDTSSLSIACDSAAIKLAAAPFKTTTSTAAAISSISTYPTCVSIAAASTISAAHTAAAVAVHLRGASQGSVGSTGRGATISSTAAAIDVHLMGASRGSVGSTDRGAIINGTAAAIDVHSMGASRGSVGSTGRGAIINGTADAAAALHCRCCGGVFRGSCRAQASSTFFQPVCTTQLRSGLPTPSPQCDAQQAVCISRWYAVLQPSSGSQQGSGLRGGVPRQGGSHRGR